MCFSIYLFLKKAMYAIKRLHTWLTIYFWATKIIRSESSLGA